MTIDQSPPGRRAGSPLTGRERLFGADDIIVSKTDRKGIVTYANDVFLRVSGYNEAELLGRPHNIVRHPDMPRCVYRLLWQRIAAGHEIFAYVVNRAKNGDHYWVFAHVTPVTASPVTGGGDDGGDGRIAGYHSSRRLPRREAVAAAAALYADLRAEEGRHTDPGAGMAAAGRRLDGILSGQGVDYDQFVLGL